MEFKYEVITERIEEVAMDAVTHKFSASIVARSYHEFTGTVRSLFRVHVLSDEEWEFYSDMIMMVLEELHEMDILVY